MKTVTVAANHVSSNGGTVELHFLVDAPGYRGGDWRARIVANDGISMKRWTIWVAFALCQAQGCVLPLFANVHSNPAPLFGGIVFLLPGSLAMFFMQDWNAPGGYKSD